MEIENEDGNVFFPFLSGNAIYVEQKNITQDKNGRRRVFVLFFVVVGAMVSPRARAVGGGKGGKKEGKAESAAFCSFDLFFPSLFSFSSSSFLSLSLDRNGHLQIQRLISVSSCDK